MDLENVPTHFNGIELEVWRVSDKEIFVRFKNCEVKDGMVLVGVVGRGRTFDEAFFDYIKQVKGKTLVFNAWTDQRKEILFDKQYNKPLDVAPIVHGYWIRPLIAQERSYKWQCSECGKIACCVYNGGKHNKNCKCTFLYCPNCGAKMDTQIKS